MRYDRITKTLLGNVLQRKLLRFYEILMKSKIKKSNHTDPLDSCVLLGNIN